MDVWKTLKYPHMTEKSVGMVESENKIVFIVDRKSNKIKIKNAFEEAFNVKVDKVNTEITMKGLKKAYIKLNKKNKAIDVAVKLGMV